MSKKLTVQQKEYNRLLGLKARAAGQVAKLRELLAVAEGKEREYGLQLEKLRPQPGLVLNASEKALIHSGQFIQAIKNLRNRSQTLGGAYLGLKEAKDMVDDYRARVGLLNRY